MQRARIQAINAEKDDAKRNDLLKAFLRSEKPGDEWYISMPFLCEYVSGGCSVELGAEWLRSRQTDPRASGSLSGTRPI